jgi:hypothetical protein
MDFGLKVRSHPAALIVTARNKMRTATDVPVQIELAGRLAETSVLLGDETPRTNNWKTLEEVVTLAKAQGQRESCSLGPFWRQVPVSAIVAAIESWNNHPASVLTAAEPLIAYIKLLQEDGLKFFDVLLRSSDKKDAVPGTFAGLKISHPERNVAVLSKTKIEFLKRRVASRGDERAGLDIDPDKLAAMKAEFKKGNIPDKKFRIYRGEHGLPPLFIINCVSVTKTVNGSELGPKEVATFGVSFPGDPGASRRPKKLVTYTVNLRWWRDNYYECEEDE